MVQIRIWTLTFLVLLFFPLAAPAKQPADDCAWQFAGHARKAVKLRTAAQGTTYDNHNNGDPISLDNWFEMVCAFDDQVPAHIPATKAIKDVETVRVTLRGFLLGARFERDDDHDIHAELGATNDWDTKHVIVEIPPGAEWCQARQALWGLVEDDIRQAHGSLESDRWILHQPPEVLVSGYVFLDSAHGSTNYCHANGGRGLHKGQSGSKVQGLWEIHPVFSVKPVATTPHDDQ